MAFLNHVDNSHKLTQKNRYEENQLTYRKVGFQEQTVHKRDLFISLNYVKKMLYSHSIREMPVKTAIAERSFLAVSSEAIKILMGHLLVRVWSHRHSHICARSLNWCVIDGRWSLRCPFWCPSWGGQAHE